MDSPASSPNSNLGEGLTLLVYLHPAITGYAVLDARDLHVIDIKFNEFEGRTSWMTEDLRSWLTAHSGVINRPYQDIEVHVRGSAFQLIPADSEAPSTDLNSLNRFEEDDVERLMHDIGDMRIEFTLESGIHALLTAHFEAEILRFGETGLIRAAIQSDEDAVFCNIAGKEASIAARSNGMLKFFNRFRIEGKEDLLYYILLTFQTHELDSRDSVLYVSGKIDFDSPMHALLCEYVRNVHIRYWELETDLEDGAVNPHYVANLLSREV